MSDPQSRRIPGYSLGMVMLLLGGAMLAFAPSIQRRGAGGNHDPGPTAFPVAIACLLVAGGLYEVLTAMRFGRLDSKRVDLIVLLIALPTYLAALPWLGFNLATFLFAVVILKRLRTPWWISLIAPVVLVALIQLLFTRIFSVPLPTSAWELPI